MVLNAVIAFLNVLWGGNLFTFLVHLFDIFLITFLFYKFLQFTKGTRSARVLLSLVVILLLFILSQFLPLISTKLLFGTFFSYFIILFTILFREEIRKLLSSFDWSVFAGKLSDVDYFLMIEEIAEALKRLAESRVGALVIVARSGNPVPHTTGGVEIQALVKKELILAIFQKESPLHDGAIIIQKGRIERAGAVLPLSMNPNIDPNFGTRHRAAYGISEIVDSIVFVVSEERGQISMLVNGRITRNMNKNMILKTLKKYLDTEIE